MVSLIRPVGSPVGTVATIQCAGRKSQHAQVNQVPRKTTHGYFRKKACAHDLRIQGSPKTSMVGIPQNSAYKASADQASDNNSAGLNMASKTPKQ